MNVTYLLWKGVPIFNAIDPMVVRRTAGMTRKSEAEDLRVGREYTFLTCQ